MPPIYNGTEKMRPSALNILSKMNCRSSSCAGQYLFSSSPDLSQRLQPLQNPTFNVANESISVSTVPGSDFIWPSSSAPSNAFLSKNSLLRPFLGLPASPTIL